MIERFDHAVIGVPDLQEGIAAFQDLGFEVSEGGSHPSLGTRNAIVRFGLDYLELLSVEHPQTARDRGAFGSELVSFLERSSGLVGYVLAGVRLERQAERFEALGPGAEGPFEMDRIRPDGRRLEWRLVVPGGSPWRKPWPYLIDWITAESDLLAWDPPGDHANGVAGVAGLDLVVEDLEAARPIFEQALGLDAGTRPPAHRQPGRRSRLYGLGAFRLGVHEPSPGNATAGELRQRGPGPFRLTLRSGDVTSSARVLSRRGVRFSETPRGLDIEPDQAVGARLRIVAA